jgi:hypothetical protein
MSMRCITQAAMVIGLVLSGCANSAGDSADQVRNRDTAVDGQTLHYEWRDLSHYAPLGLTANRELIAYTLDGCPDDCEYDLLKFDLDGNTTLLARDFLPRCMNERGDVGGGVMVREPDGELMPHAAIVHADGQLEVLPPPPDEFNSSVDRISDGGTVLVAGNRSDPTPQALTWFWNVLMDGETFPIALDRHGSDQIIGINDRGELAGTSNVTGGGPLTAFRYDARSNTKTSLGVTMCDPATRSSAINQRGDILGQFYPDFRHVEIGTWNEANQFTVQSAPVNAFGANTITNQLVWNEAGLIIFSWTDDGHTYLIPRPGERLDLASLVGGCTLPPNLIVDSVNEHGDFLAWSSRNNTFHVFLRTD